MPVELVILARSSPEPAVPTVDGLREVRLTDPGDLARAIRALRRGVVAVEAPPATALEIELVARSRVRRPAIRALLVTAPTSVEQRLDALAAGFDDAIAADAGPHEIAGRIRVLAERVRQDARDRLPVGPGMELDLTARALRRDGRLVHLRPLEFRLLDELARNPGRPVSRSRLLRQVWGTTEMDGSRTVDVHVRWLRAKVERDAEHPVHLLTVRGVGYQLELGSEDDDAS
jgi:DNA-binding response OmpR family regulator